MKEKFLQLSSFSLQPPWKLLLKLLSDYHLDICPHKHIFNSPPNSQGSTIQCFQHLLGKFHLLLAVGNYLLRSECWQGIVHWLYRGQLILCNLVYEICYRGAQEMLWLVTSCAGDGNLIVEMLMYFGKAASRFIYIHMRSTDKETCGTVFTLHYRTICIYCGRWNCCVSHHPHRHSAINNVFDEHLPVVVHVMSPGSPQTGPKKPERHCLSLPPKIPCMTVLCSQSRGWKPRLCEKHFFSSQTGPTRNICSF